MNQIKELDLNNIITNPKILIIGKKQYGKSFLCNSLLKHYNTSNKKIVVYDSDYYTYSDPECQYMRFENHIFEKILLEHLQKRNENPTYNTILCLDDCLHHKKIFENYTFLKMLYSKQQLGITIIMTSQSISSHFVEIFDYIFAFHDDNLYEREKLYIRYFNKLKPFAFFNTIFDDVTKNNYTTLVIDRNMNSNKITDNFFYFQAI